MSEIALNKLVLGARVKHTASSKITGDATSVTKLSTDSADYTSGSTGNTIDMNGANTPTPRFVVVTNYDAAIILHVEVGNDLALPPAATDTSFPVLAGTSEWFQIPAGGKGVGGVVKVKGESGSPVYSLNWIF